jgi:predicted O-methyltransferase YrrM
VDIQLLPATKAMLERYGLTGRWTFTLQDDLEYIKTWPADKKADLIFIDTSHTFDHTTKEIAAYEPILRPGGTMAFHDTMSFYEGVQKPIKAFLKAHKDWSYENKANCNGLGILRKPA